MPEGPYSESHVERPSMVAWDVNTAAALIVLAALAFLFLVRRGFRGVTVNLGA